MPKILRSSLYTDPYDRTPTTMVVRERDVVKSLEEVADEMERVTPVALVVNDIFEVDEHTYNDPVKTSLAGAKRLADSARLETELHMAMSFYWNADQLSRVTSRGMLVNPGAAPLTAEQLTVVVRQLGKHPNYRHQTIMLAASDGKIVQLYPTGQISVRNVP